MNLSSARDLSEKFGAFSSGNTTLIAHHVQSDLGYGGRDAEHKNPHRGVAAKTITGILLPAFQANGANIRVTELLNGEWDDPSTLHPLLNGIGDKRACPTGQGHSSSAFKGYFSLSSIQEEFIVLTGYNTSACMFDSANDGVHSDRHNIIVPVDGTDNYFLPREESSRLGKEEALSIMQESGVTLTTCGAIKQWACCI